MTIHPYGAAPPDSTSPYGFGPVAEIIKRFRAVVRPQAMKNKALGAEAKVWVTEWGVNWDDFGRAEQSPNSEAVAYQQAMMNYLLTATDIEVAFFFCWTVQQRPGLGLNFVDGAGVEETEAARRLQEFTTAISDLV